MAGRVAYSQGPVLKLIIDRSPVLQRDVGVGNELRLGWQHVQQIWIERVNFAAKMTQPFDL